MNTANFVLSGQRLQGVDNERDPGVTFQIDLSFDICDIISEKLRKANSMIVLIRRTLRHC